MILQEYFQANGYEFTAAGKKRLAPTMKGIKLNHHFKKQGTGANPMIFDDLDHILKSMFARASVDNGCQVDMVLVSSAE